MGRASIFVYITVALVVLFFLSLSPKHGHHNNRHCRLKLRSNYTLSPSRHHNSVAFDPLVAELERHSEDKQWEKQHIHHSHPELDRVVDSAPGPESQPEWEDFMDAEDFINDEDKFNVTSRLLLLFPKLDVDPTDSYVSLHELTQWNLEQAQREVLHRSQREMDLHDKNHDGFVSFSEYDPPSWVQNADTSVQPSRSKDLDKLLLRPGNLVGPRFEPGVQLRDDLQEYAKVLVVGAGGLGCELLKDLALTGFRNLEFIDMDRIEITNLNRQFLFRLEDVGKPKAEVAAKRVMERISGVQIVPHFCRIEDKDIGFYNVLALLLLVLIPLRREAILTRLLVAF